MGWRPRSAGLETAPLRASCRGCCQVAERPWGGRGGASSVWLWPTAGPLPSSPSPAAASTAQVPVSDPGPGAPAGVSCWEHRLGACPLPARELASPGPAQSLVQASVSSLHPSQQMVFSCPAGGRTPARKPGWCPRLARPGISPPHQLRPGHSSPTSPTSPPPAPSCPERTLEFSHHVPFRACVETPPSH